MAARYCSLQPEIHYEVHYSQAQPQSRLEKRLRKARWSSQERSCISWKKYHLGGPRETRLRVCITASIFVVWFLYFFRFPHPYLFIRLLSTPTYTINRKPHFSSSILPWGKLKKKSPLQTSSFITKASIMSGHSRNYLCSKIFCSSRPLRPGHHDEYPTLVLPHRIFSPLLTRCE